MLVSKGPPIGNDIWGTNGHVTDDVTMTSRDPRKCYKAVRSAILTTAWLLV